jgi:putative metal binding uncharacterized protein
MLRPDDPLLDLAVARSKFAAAETIYAARDLYRKRGWVVEQPAFPILTVRFKDRRGNTKAGVQLLLRNYDFLPPSVTFLDENGRPHSAETLGLLLRPHPQANVPPALKDGYMLTASTGGYLPGAHPFTQLPFLCVKGVWEYHVHPQHAEVAWEWIRTDPGYGLQSVIANAHHAFQESVFR